MLKKSKGFTNVEMILTVGITSVLATAVYFIYENTSDRRQVSSEINNVSGLIEKISSATTASNYSDLNNQKLLDLGIYYKPEFREFEIRGLSPKSFQVTYNLLNSRVCSDLAMKTALMKGEYKLTRKINGVDAGFTPVDVASSCNTQKNKIELVFDGLNVQNIASVIPGTPKPPPIYAGEGTFTPDLPDRGDVPTNLADASKNTNNPSKPIPGAYTPPAYIVATAPTLPNGNASNPGGLTVRPNYVGDKPLGPLVTPPDNGNEFVPAVPPAPPKPPALAPPPPPPQPSSYETPFNIIWDTQLAAEGTGILYQSGDKNVWYIEMGDGYIGAIGECLIGYVPDVIAWSGYVVPVSCHK